MSRRRVAAALACAAFAASLAFAQTADAPQPDPIEALRAELAAAKERIRALEIDRERYATLLLRENRLSQDLQACRGDLSTARAEAARASQDLDRVRTDLRRAEDRARSAEQSARRAQDSARRAESRARRCP